MAREQINLGSQANDGTGDKLRVAFTKTQNNFVELYNTTNDLITENQNHLRIVETPTTPKGVHGDDLGCVSYDDNYYYFCTAVYDGTSDIWKKINWSGDAW